MYKRFLAVFVAALIVAPLALFGCKGKVDKSAEMEEPIEIEQAMTEEMSGAALEPAETIAVETIPPTAAGVKAPAIREGQARDKDIQRALKKAGFYGGAVDGKIGPRTKEAIREFQRSKGLKVDGKVGPRTWAEMEKYLTEQ